MKKVTGARSLGLALCTADCVLRGSVRDHLTPTAAFCVRPAMIE